MAGASGDGGGSRVPNNWQGLFRFCQEATLSEDASGESSFVEMDPENVLESQDGAADAKGAKATGAASSDHKGHPKCPPIDLDPETARVNQDKALEALGLFRYRIPGDGNCLYRAVAWQLKFDQDKYHPLLRRVSVKWMKEYSQELMASGLLDAVGEIEETEKLGSWPGQAAIVSLANIFGINIAIVQGGDKGDIDIQHIAPFEQETCSDQGSVILAYLYNGHYDAVVDTPDMDNPDFERWMLNVLKAHNEGTLTAQSPVAQDPYYSYVLHNGYDTLKLRQQEGEKLPAYVATSAPASGAPPPHLNDAASLHDLRTLEQEPLRFETDHSLETIRSLVVDRPTVELQEVFTPDDEEVQEHLKGNVHQGDLQEEFTLNGVKQQQNISLQDTLHNLDNERESAITNKLAYRDVREGDVILDERSTLDSLSDSPVPMTTDDVMTDLDLRDNLPSDMFASSSASSLATESEMSIHLDDDIETASVNSHFDSDCDSRFAHAGGGDHPPESSILFDDVFDHGSDPDPPEQTVTIDPRYTKSLDRRFLRNRSREGLSCPPQAEEETKARPSFRPRQRIQRSERTTGKEGTPYTRPQQQEKKTEGWGIKTSDLLQAAGLTQANQKYGPIKLEEPRVMSPEGMMNQDSLPNSSNTGTLRSDRFLAKHKREGRKGPALKTDVRQTGAKQSVLSPPADIPNSANVLSNLEGLREWRLKYGPQASRTVVHDGESSEAIREGSYDSPDIYMRRSESREESVESVIHVPSQQQKDSLENSTIKSAHNDSNVRQAVQDMAHSEEMTVAGGYANNTQPLSSSSAMHGDYMGNNTRSVASPHRTFMSDRDTGDSNTMTRSLPYKRAAVGSDNDRNTQSNTSSPSSTDGTDGPRGFSRRRAGASGYQHPRIARSKSNDAILGSPDRNGFDPNDCTRGTEQSDSSANEPGYDTLKGSARAQALLKSRMRPGRSPGRSLGKDAVGDSGIESAQSDSVHTSRSGPSSYASLPYRSTRDKSYEPDDYQSTQSLRSTRSGQNSHGQNDQSTAESAQSHSRDFASLSPQPDFNPEPAGPSVFLENQPSQSHPDFSSSRPAMSSSYTSSSSHASEGPGLSNEELVNARRFSLESSQRVEDVLVKDPTQVLPTELLSKMSKAQSSGTKDKTHFEASRRFKQAEQDYVHKHSESESRGESESRDVGVSSKVGSSNFTRASNASQNIGQSSFKHEQHAEDNQHDTSMNQVDSQLINKELTVEEKSVAAAYSTQSVSADVMSGMSALSGISLNKSAEPPVKAPPRFVRQLSSPSLGRKVLQETIINQEPQSRSFTRPEPVVPKDEPTGQPKIRQEPIVQPKAVVKDEPIVQPRSLQDENTVLQEPLVRPSQMIQSGPVLEPPKTDVPQAPIATPKPVAQPKTVQQGPVLVRPSVQPKPFRQQKPVQPIKIMHQEGDNADQQNGPNAEKDQLAEPHPFKEKEHVSPPVLHAEDSSYGLTAKMEQNEEIMQEHQGNELMKSKLYQQQQLRMQEIQDEEGEVINAAAEPSSVRRQEITSQVSSSDEVKAPRMRVLPLHFVGRKGNTFSRQLSQEEEQALMSRRAKREEYEKQSSKDSSRDQTPLRGRSSTRESSQDSFQSAHEEPASRSPKRYRSVERILVNDTNADVTVNGNAAAVNTVPLSPGIEIRVASDQGAAAARNEQVGAQEEVQKVTENVIHERQENLFEKIRSGATHHEVEGAMRPAPGATEQGTAASTPQEGITSPRIIQTEAYPYQYQSPPETPSYASSVCSSTGLREVEEIHCQHPGHNHQFNYRNVKARSQVPTSLLFPGKVTSNRTSPAGSTTSSPFVTPPTSGRTSPQMYTHPGSTGSRRTVPVQVVHETRKPTFMRSASHWDDRHSDDFGKRVDSMFNQHLEERRGSVPITIQRVSRQPADGASIPQQGQEKFATNPSVARSNSVPNAAEPTEGEQDDRPPPGIVKDRLREWVEGQRAHQGNWDGQSQQSDATSQTQTSDAGTQYEESGSMYSEDSRDETATPTPSDGTSYAPSYRRYNSRPETYNSRPEMHNPYYQTGGQQRMHREFIEERGTTDPTGGTSWHRSFATESAGFDRPDAWSARVELPNRPDWPRTGRRERFLRLRDRPFFMETERSFGLPSMLRPMRHGLRDDIKSAFDDDWFFRH